MTFNSVYTKIRTPSHEVAIKFQLPVVGDSVIWKNPENHKEGYKVKRGKQNKRSWQMNLKARCLKNVLAY